MRIAEAIVDHARKRPHDDAVIEAGLRLSWDEFNRDVHARARALQQNGIRRGSRVVVELPNGREFLSTMVATWLLGAIFVPLNLRWAEREKAAAIRDASADIVVRPGTIHPLPGPIKLPTVAADAVAAIYYTSGSSGEPKGVVHTHATVEANARQFIDALDLGRGDINYGAAPFFHVAGLAVFTVPLLLAGGTTVCARSFEPARALSELDAYGCTCACMVPQMWSRLTRHINFDEANLSLRIAVSGGAPTPSNLIDTYRRRGVEMVRGYGMTEAGPMVSIQRPGSQDLSDFDCGLPGPEVDIAIVDEDRRSVEEGAEGEVAIRGPNVMARYWKRPAVTATALDEDGWFYTRDRGRIRDGKLEVFGRVDDMIITGGENVFPSEIEAILREVESIEDVAIIGIPDKEWGEAVAAIVVPRSGHTVSESTLVAALIGSVARYKIPRILQIVDVLPVAPTGKVDRAALRERFADVTTSATTSRTGSS